MECAHLLKKELGIRTSDIICFIKCKLCGSEILKKQRKLKNEYCSKSCSSKATQNNPEFKERLKIITEKNIMQYIHIDLFEEQNKE